MESSLIQKLRKLLNREGGRLKKELEAELADRCIHRHTRETHPNCFRNGRTKKLLNTQRWYDEEDLVMGFFDIETTDLIANKGFMLSWAVKFRNEDEPRHDIIKPEEIYDGTFDQRITESLINTFHDLDILVTYYGTGFDIKYTRSRAIFNGLNFPGYGSIYHFDVYYRTRSLLKLHKSSLDAATRFLGIEGKNHVHIDDWGRAAYGDQDALDYVLDHNVRDVQILEELFDVLEPYSKWTRKSI